MFNKAVLSSFDFPFPMFLTTWHMVVSMVLTQFLSKTTDLLPGVREVINMTLILSSDFDFVSVARVKLIAT
jgi:hypothetical protein